MKKILVLGSSGMLGHAAVLRLEELGYSVFGISRSNKFGNESALLDISSKEEMNYFLDRNHFDVIVNCIALLVLPSEEQKDMAVYMNAYLPRFLEMKYRETDTKIIHVSTDGIFSGTKAPYYEDSPHDSQHFYGRSKYLGEIVNDKDLTVRSAFWGPDLNKMSASFFNWILNQKGQIKGFTNHIFNGVSSLEFAGFLDIAIRGDLSGIFHLTAQEPISKCDFIRSVKDIFGTDNEVLSAQAPQSVDRTLINSRSEVPYAGADYNEMLTACLRWMQERKELYPHYEMI